jgi:hypothetical protein
MKAVFQPKWKRYLPVGLDGTEFLRRDTTDNTNTINKYHEIKSE